MNGSPAYVDDITVFLNTEEHKFHVSELFKRLDKFGVLTNVLKCEFGVNSVLFLGHSVSASTRNQTITIQNHDYLELFFAYGYSLPMNIKQLCQF